MLQLKINLSGSGGLINGFHKHLKQHVYFGGESQMVDGIYNPFSHPGYLTPARTARKDLTLANNSVIHKTCIYDPVSDKFLSGSTDGHITYWSGLDSTTYSSDITTGTPDNIIDFEVYQLNGSRKIFYSSIDGSNGYVGVTDGTYFQFDWSNGGSNANLYTGTVTGSGTFTSAGPFMRVASNNFMYIYDKNRVHKVDGTASGGTAGTITANVLTFADTYRIVDAVDWKNLNYIAVQDEANPYNYSQGVSRFSRSAGVFVWDRVSTTVSTRDFIPIYGVKEIKRIYIAHDGKLRAMTVGASTQFQIREFTGSSFEVIFELDLSASPTTHDGVTISEYATFWLGNDLNVYAHGRYTPGAANGVYKVGKLTNGTITSVGYCYFANGSTEVATGTDCLFMSYINNSSSYNKTQKFLLNFYGSIPGAYSAGAPYASEIYTKNISLPVQSNVEDMFVYLLTSTTSDSGDGTSICASVKVYLNQSATAFGTYNITRSDIRNGYIRIPINKQFVNNIQVSIDYSTTQNSGVTITSFDACPSYAILNYEPTETKK